MNNQLFNNSKDRDDFLIALVVIGFFLWLFLFSGILGKKRNLASLVSAKETTVIMDSDDDGIIDSVDECPDVFAKTATGCPEKKVKESKGYVAPVATEKEDVKVVIGKEKMDAEILPIPAPVKIAEEPTVVDNDKDNDGVPNDIDECPNKKGTADNRGCPDTDRDGVIDKEDACPEVAGVKENDGCPKLILEENEKAVITEAIRDVRFEYGSDRLTVPSQAILNKVVALMQKYPDSRLSIGGHTDNDSSSEFNLKLSNERAASCKNYLVEKGIAGRRISAKGFGETKPIATNETEEGRKKNRRVEFDLK